MLRTSFSLKRYVIMKFVRKDKKRENLMFDRILKEMRDKIRNREYILTIYGEEEMDKDSLSIYDVEHCAIIFP